MTQFDQIIKALDSRPSWMNPEHISYITVMGSRAYGAHNANSDMDFYGFCVPPVEIVFPHVIGKVEGFGRNVQRFEQYDPQHVNSELGEFDIAIYNIVKYFQLVMDGNPNMVDSLFTYDEDVIYVDEIGQLVRDNRKVFLSQKMYHTFKGMLWSHMSRLNSGHVKDGRKALAEKFGYDTKDAYHSLRMAIEMSQVLFQGDLDLKRNSDLLKSVRAGEKSLEQVTSMVNDIMERTEKDRELYSVVPYVPEEAKIHKLLLNCLEIRFGSLKKYGIAFSGNMI